ncbi:sigma-54 dependent transcriptional regulator [Deferribacterales bacterium RsTz2092]|nr:sigma-54-dependent Fis family transcriptional regulator [Deferribacterales bacterium]
MATKKILIVDDDDGMREALRETVARMKVAEVHTAIDGTDGFEKASNTIYDLIISDMRMPRTTGLEMFDMLRTAGISTPICFLTAYGTVQSAVNALKNGAYDYIMKPCPPEVIEELVSRTFALNEAGLLSPRKETSELERKQVFKSAYMTHVFTMAKKIASSESTVLITGESGTGKEVLAHFIHDNSKRSKGPFVPVNCAAIPENLLESELFGYEKGAFTDAQKLKIGKFEAANGGTLLLDELGEIPLHLQPKLLRVLQEKEVERLGSTTKAIKIDTRIVATTNRDIQQMVREGKFREDLFYRLNVFPVELPPLRERMDDLPDLANFFINKYSTLNKKPIKPLAQGVMAELLKHDWPGNVRELEHTIERAVVLAEGGEIDARALFMHGITMKVYTTAHNGGAKSVNSYGTTSHVEDKTIEDMERELILNTLQKTNDNRTKAAELLGITVRTLRNKLNEYKKKGQI